jgi:hypothetical protein
MVGKLVAMHPTCKDLEGSGGLIAVLAGLLLHKRSILSLLYRQALGWLLLS